MDEDDDLIIKIDKTAPRHNWQQNKVEAELEPIYKSFD